MIKIGNNNKINKSIIGNSNEVNDKSSNRLILENYVLPVIVGLTVAGIVFLLKWN